MTRWKDDHQMNRLKNGIAALLLVLPLASCASYNAYQKAQGAEKVKDWDNAVVQYEKALEIDPDNMRYRIARDRAKLESSRTHFEKGKTILASAAQANGNDRIRLAQLAATELEITVKLDSTNQFAATELGHAVRMIQDAMALLSNDKNSIEAMKKRASITKAQPPQLNPASNEPISLSFPHETPVKDIYRALGNAFGINILFDQAVKDDRISIELKDVTAQQALERVMQAASHFYKVLDEHTIIIIPDNPQARRDYEDLVIQTFYLSNGDAEQVTNVVRTMIEARNVFPLKALNAITIRDTADKVRIAEKIIQANDKAKAEVVVDVELLQMDLDKLRDIGFAISGASGPIVTTGTDADGKPVQFTGVATPSAATLEQLRNLTAGSFSFAVPTPTYALVKSLSDTHLLANPELRISEGEKATLHIGQRIPVPVSTFTSVAPGTTNGSTFAPVTSFQYQDVGIKVSMEPRVHHNREVTLKLTVEVSNLGAPVKTAGQPDQPTFSTRTIESTIRLKDGETNFLAGLIQQTEENSDTDTPFLSDIPILGRLFTQTHKRITRTDLVMTMTPHIIRIPDITDEDVAPMWVGTQNNLTFRGVSPRIESQAAYDPFTAMSNQPAGSMRANANDTEGNNPPEGAGRPVNPGVPPQGSAPTDPFKGPVPNNPPQPEPQVNLNVAPSTATAQMASVSDAALRLSPRIGPQPSNLAIKPGEEKVWNVIGMDLDGLSASSIQLHYDPKSIDVSEVMFGDALRVDPKTPPVATINRETGTIRIVSSDGKPLAFASGGEVVGLRVRGGATGETYLVMENPDFRDGKGTEVMSAIAGGKAKVE
jgi:general secretion pathway protein D